MYLFTRGEGTLRTTQDLFTQAYYFVEEGSRLTAIVQEFINQVSVDEYFECVYMWAVRWRLGTEQDVAARNSNATGADTIDVSSAEVEIENACFGQSGNVFQSRFGHLRNKGFDERCQSAVHDGFHLSIEGKTAPSNSR